MSRDTKKNSGDGGKQYRSYQKLRGRWTSHKTTQGVPDPRCGHTLNHINLDGSGSLLVAFGESSKQKSRRFYNDVRLYDLNRKSWQILPHAPFCPRGDHTANTIANNVYFFGGRFKQTLLGDGFFLSGLGTKTVRWIPSHSDPSPGCRRGHTITSIPRKNGLVLFGGLRGNIFFNDLWYFDVQKELWMRRKPKNEAKIPRARCFHTAFTDKSQNHLFVLGGTCLEKAHSPVIYRYDLRSDQWDVVACSDMPPCIGHTSHLLPNQDLLLYGTHHSAREEAAVPSNQCHVLGRTSKTSAIECAVLQTSGKSPEARQHHASVLVGPRVYVFGGWKPGSSSASNTLHQLELHNATPITPARARVNPTTARQVPDTTVQRKARVTLSMTPVKGKHMRARPERVTPLTVGPNAMRRTTFINPEMLEKKDKTKHNQDFTLKVINYLLTEWTPPPRATFFLSTKTLLSLCDQVLSNITQEPTLVEMKAPCKIFGDVHGQFFDLLEFFAAFGSPDHITGDIKVFNYLFLGDYVDRGLYSLEVITLLLALKLQYKSRIVLLRGNHEASETNNQYGFFDECRERLGAEGGEHVWKAFNKVFEHLPLAALIEGRILGIHGGIGRVKSLDEIAKIKRPIPVRLHTSDETDRIVADLLWSDPTQGDGEKGVSKNDDRGCATVFGPDVVREFCARNNIDLIVRAHQVVMEGYEYFANGQLITIFSATNYCGRLRNNGAMLQIDSELLVTPKYIEPNLEDNSRTVNQDEPMETRNRFTEPYFPFNPQGNSSLGTNVDIPAGSPKPSVEGNPHSISIGDQGNIRRPRAWRALDGKRPPSPLRGSSPPHGRNDSHNHKLNAL